MTNKKSGTTKEKSAKKAGTFRQVKTTSFPALAGLTQAATQPRRISVQEIAEYRLVQKDTRQGKKMLVEYGIFNEPSDWRAHVCVLAKHVYVYSTLHAMQTLREYDCERMDAPRYVSGQMDIAAVGYLVNPDVMIGLVAYPIPALLLQRYNIAEHGATRDLRVKQAIARRLVTEMYNTGTLLFPELPRLRRDYRRKQDFPNLMDVPGRGVLSVVPDFRGGHIDHGSPTGNLFLSAYEHPALIPQHLRLRA